MEYGPVAPPVKTGVHPPAAQQARADPREAPGPKLDALAKVQTATQRVVTSANSAAEVAVDPKEIEAAVAEFNEVLDLFGVSARFEIHKDSKTLQVVLADRDSGEVIRKIPPDEVLRRRDVLPGLIGATFDVTT